MLYQIESAWRRIDWILLLSTVPIVVAGLLTMNSFTSESYFFDRQLSWFLFSLAVFFIGSLIDWRFLRRSGVVVSIYLAIVFLLVSLFVVGQIYQGAQSWLSIAGFSLQPVDLMKIALVAVLAKYFSRRHIEIADLRHIIVSGLYAFIPFVLIMLQPDLGSAIVIFMIWLGMIMVSGVSKKHLLMVVGLVLVSFTIAWLGVLAPYQKERILTFIHPLADIQGAGYNAFQSTVAVGSGQILGKGLGYGTQSRLQFLPEYETDFIFAAFAEEWGFLGVGIIFVLFGIIFWRLMRMAILGATNFETLFTIGIALIFSTHIVIHIGMNVGLLPVTGLPLPLMSYGGSHLMAEFAALGIVVGMRKYSLPFHRDDAQNEFIGPQ